MDYRQLNKHSNPDAYPLPRINQLRNAKHITSLDLKHGYWQIPMAGIAAGIDGIAAEFYKPNPKKSATFLHPLIKDAWENERFASEWTDEIIVRIPKKGNLRDCDNWRGNCVLPVVAKIISEIILQRLKQHMYSTIDAEQAGFCSSSSCTDHINTIRILIEQCVEHRPGVIEIEMCLKKLFV